MEEQFSEFLLKHGIKRKFARNLKNNSPDRTIDDYVKSNKTMPCVNITSAFIWDNTPEGHCFWSEIDKEWVKEVEENETSKS